VFEPRSPPLRLIRQDLFKSRRIGETQLLLIEVLQGRKSLPLRGARVLRIRWFDPIAEASELPDHFRSAPLL
jgi:hypothetical protein